MTTATVAIIHAPGENEGSGLTFGHFWNRVEYCGYGETVTNRVCWSFESHDEPR